MKINLIDIPNFDVFLVMGILVFFIFIESIAGYLSRTQRNKSDWIQELGSFLALSLLTKPLIVFIVIFAGGIIFPERHTSLSGLNFVLGLLFYILIDDLLQYWYHRSAHEYEFLWKLHRPHHQAEEMGFFVSYRNAALYYLLMPNIWWIGICTFLGLGKAVALGLVLKQLVVISSHSTLSYDKFLYRHKILKPLAFIVEHIFITPAFHHAHHGKSKLDGISDPNGNFGNMFSIWDQVFGTAMFTRKFPTEYGLVNDTRDTWKPAMLYPLVKSSSPKSELSHGFKKDRTSKNTPASVMLTKGEKYLYCQCGLSQNQPYCDGSHHGTKFKPLLFEALKTGKVKLCNCKRTNSAPFCDDSHLV